MKKKKYNNNNNIILVFIISLSFFYGCKKEQKNTVTSSISVDINKEDKVSIFDLFSAVEIIRLETNDSSIIKYIDKLLVYNDAYYIFDYSMAQILSFNKEGNFEFCIKNIGEGPDQYIKLSDFDIYNDSLSLISIIDKTLHMYDLKGDFIRRISLPKVKGNYKNIRYLNNDTIAFWTYDYDNRLKFFSKINNNIFKESMPEERNIYTSFSTPVFPYGNYIVKAFDNRVMEMSVNGELTLAYQWNFGSLNNDTDNLVKGPNSNDANSQTEMYEFARKIYSSEIVNYFFGLSGGNSQYVYTQIMRKNKNKSILFNKKTKKEYVFEKTTENANFFPLFWTEEYAIGYIPEIEEIGINDIIPDQILNDKNRAIKKEITEYDNPILIKYYFKK